MEAEGGGAAGAPNIRGDLDAFYDNLGLGDFVDTGPIPLANEELAEAAMGQGDEHGGAAAAWVLAFFVASQVSYARTTSSDFSPILGAFIII